jgi:hypothetical protein
LYLFQSHFASQHKSVAKFASAASIQQVLISIYSVAKMKLHKQKYEPTKLYIAATFSIRSKARTTKKTCKKDMQVARSISCTSHHEVTTSHHEPPAGHQDVNLKTKRIRQLTCSANKTKTILCS